MSPPPGRKRSTSTPSIPAALERERAVLSEQARASGKPENIIEKMVEGRIRKYYEEVVLLEQVWVHDGESRVRAVVKKAGVTLTGFVRFQLGEGIEKPKDDFAAEVAATAGVCHEPATRSGPARTLPLVSIKPSGSPRRPRLATSWPVPIATRGLFRTGGSLGCRPFFTDRIGSCMTQPAVYKRVLLKLSGEALMGRREFGLDNEMVGAIANDIKAVVAMGVEVSVVIGGGNIFRGVSGAASGMDRAQADYMGMLATVMNALAMQSALEKRDVPTRVQSAIPMASVCEPYIRRRAERHMEKGRVVVFAAGTGNPFFTTDTAAALRAAEMKCDALLKGTQVDGVYSADPRKVTDATRYEQLTYLDVLANDLGVMDAAAISLARENHLPIIVFNIHAPGAFAQVMRGEGAFHQDHRTAI